MKIYVASAWSDFRVARAAQNMLRAMGHTISHDWTEGADEYTSCEDASDEVCQQAAWDDEEGVLTAHAFLLCAPATGGSGCWTELGLARSIARATHAVYPIVVCGPGRDRNIFARLGHRLESVEEAVAWLHARSEWLALYRKDAGL